MRLYGLPDTKSFMLAPAPAIDLPETCSARSIRTVAMPPNRRTAPSLNLTDREAIELFARVLKQAGYPGPGAQEVLGKELGVLHRKRDLPLYLRRLSGTPQLKTLVKLFAFQVHVDEKEARSAFAPLELERAADLGVVRIVSTEVVPLISISSFDRLLMAHDRTSTDVRESADPEHVLGISPPTLVLARLIPRQPVDAALDIGTGCGAQALMVAAFCKRVIATDLNRRALNFAAFNALLNDIRNVEFRFGSLFEPVDGESFDLIISNPPYVISPESSYLFRDGGKSADSFCSELIRAIPSRLNEGGFASTLCNWARYSKDEHWSGPVRRWVAGNGCDCWALHGHEHEPIAYAADWNRHRESQAYERALSEWTEYYQKLGICTINSGGVVLRRRQAAKNWFRMDELTERVNPLSSAILRVFQMENWLADISDEELLAQSFSVGEGHCITQTLKPSEGDYAIEQMQVHGNDELGFQASIDPHTFHLLRRCDGRRPLKDVLAEISKFAGIDSAICLQKGVVFVRELLAHGILAPCKLQPQTES
ncbi:MAG: hypothetical protein JWM99_1226 [Verrucomicrobiales bacterium]|nr:hypothetical protein [Verrucomicrobiales bacterium]